MENNFREILFLIEQIDVLKALLKDMKDGVHNHSLPVHRDAVQDQATTDVLDEARQAGVWIGVRQLWDAHPISSANLVPTGINLCPLEPILASFYYCCP